LAEVYRREENKIGVKKFALDVENIMKSILFHVKIIFTVF